ncbi:MAG: hypothetical protein ACE5HI_16520, partial [bacterium]
MTNKFYLKLILAALLLLPIIGMAQATNNQLDFLKPLVGEKCAVYLKNGDVINGTLWVYGHDYVSLKVKKGLLYSKTEKYAVSEIDYIKDKAANRYYMPKVSKLSNEKPPTRLYIGPDASDVSEHSNADQEFQGTLRFLKSGEKKQDGQKASEPAPQHVVPQTVQPKVAKTTPPSQQPNIVDKSMPEKSSIFRTPQQTGTPRHGRKPAAVVPVSGKAQIASHKKADDSAKMAKAEPRQKPLVATPVGSSEAKELKILRYQTFVLFGCAALIVALLMFFKMTGLKGTTYGKYTLFPSRIIKLEGDYGIIDQGKVDGVKTDDILRLYKKSGSRVQYKA